MPHWFHQLDCLSAPRLHQLDCWTAPLLHQLDCWTAPLLHQLNCSTAKGQLDCSTAASQLDCSTAESHSATAEHPSRQLAHLLILPPCMVYGPPPESGHSPFPCRRPMLWPVRHNICSTKLGCLLGAGQVRCHQGQVPSQQSEATLHPLRTTSLPAPIVHGLVERSQGALSALGNLAPVFGASCRQCGLLPRSCKWQEGLIQGGTW